MKRVARAMTKRRAIAILVAILIAMLVLWPASASLRGHFAARIDVARSHYVLFTYGQPVEWLPTYTRLLREKYGVQSRAVAGCGVSPWLRSYVDAYDDVMTAAAKRKFGRDIFKESMDQAREVTVNHS